MAAQGEEVEAKEEEAVVKCVRATHSPVVPPPTHPPTEFVPVSNCSSVWIFSVKNVLLFPTRVRVGVCV